MRVCFLLASVLLVSATSAAQDDPFSEEGLTLPGNVFLADPSYMRGASENRPPPVITERLELEEEERVSAVINDLPPFPDNPYDGCHARAHLIFSSIDRILPNKSFKVWLFSGRSIAPALHGSISYAFGEGSSTSWDYHVANGFVGADGRTMIVDTIISSDPIHVSEWLSAFEINGPAMLTALPGRLYLFNRTEVPALSSDFPNGFRKHYMSRNVVNGEFYEYEGEVAMNRSGAVNIATDAVSSALQSNQFPGCEWISVASQSDDLRTRLHDLPIPSECVGAKSLYDAEFIRWVELGL